MDDELKRRIKSEAEYIIDTGSTLRYTAKIFNYSKSTVHKDVSERLLSIDKGLYDKVKAVLQNNFSERHIRGGEATKRKYSENRRNIKNT